MMSQVMFFFGRHPWRTSHITCSRLGSSSKAIVTPDTLSFAFDFSFRLRWNLSELLLRMNEALVDA